MQKMTANILGVHVHSINVNELIELIIQACIEKRKVTISYVNVHAINIAYQLRWFKDFLNSSEVVFCDGYGVKRAAEFLNQPVLYRNTPPDWISLLAHELAIRDYTLYLLGAHPGIIEKAAAALTRREPSLKIVGCYHGYFEKKLGSAEQRTVLEEINRVKPKVLLVGFGMPAQEEWLKTNLASLNINVAMPVGALFDYLAGNVYRAPRWMTDHGLEWLGRLIIEPKRLWKRYVLGNPLFLWRVFKQKIGWDKYDE